MNPQFYKLISEAGLERVASQLLNVALPAIGFSAQKVQSHSRIGSSQIGGLPSLPPDFEWPTNKDRRLDFLMQINLADVAFFDAKGLLPRSGILSFFYDMENQPWGYDPADLDGYKVIYTKQEAPLSAHNVPTSGFEMPECELTFYSLDTLPHYGSRAADSFVESAGLSDSEQDAYFELPFQFEKISHPSDNMSYHHLLGHSANVQGDMQLEAQLVTNGLYCGDSTGYEDPRFEALEAGADDWLLLLQLDSDDVNDFMWGDCGMLYYWIRREDLVNLRFEKVWMTLQCS